MKTEEMKKVELWLKANNVYVMSSIEGKGHHLGRFKGFSLDADDNLIIDVDIDSLSCTT